MTRCAFALLITLSVCMAQNQTSAPPPKTAPPAANKPEGPKGFPAGDESLQYTINWPSGLSLGEGHLRAQKAADRWSFAFDLKAAVPGFAVEDRYRSQARLDLCSLEFEKDTLHGQRKTREKTTFDLRKKIARRATANGGKSEIPVAACTHDGLAYVFYVRRELAQGRVPPAQTVLFGAPYEVRLEYSGKQSVTVNEKRMEADRVLVSLKGPASEAAFEAFFARDAGRTPVLIRAPFAPGILSLELVR